MMRFFDKADAIFYKAAQCSLLPRIQDATPVYTDECHFQLKLFPHSMYPSMAVNFQMLLAAVSY